MSHPMLIPDKHPMCGDIMRAMIECHDTAGWRRMYGACEELNYKLSKCLAAEKKEARADRQQKFQERWTAKKAANEARMAELELEQAARLTQQAAEAAAGAPVATTQ